MAKQKDLGVSFEQTGIDYLMVDEAHEYSNLRTLSNIQGGGATGSGMATDLHMKLEYIRENSRTGRVATFATGTPIGVISLAVDGGPYLKISGTSVTLTITGLSVSFLAIPERNIISPGAYPCRSM